MRKKDWRYRSATERRFASAINQITKRVKFITKRKDTLFEIIAALKALADSPEWRAIAWAEARKMVQMVAVENASTWREAARQSQQGAEIHRLLKMELAGNTKFHALIRSNADFITSIPADIARDVTKQVSVKAIAGLRPEAILEDIRKMAPHLSEKRSKLIARTEVAKTQAAITEIRATDIGLNFYVWRTCGDQRVRSSHKHMDGVICSFLSPPCPELLDPDTPASAKRNSKAYGPGNIYNCRCYAEPIVDPDFVDFPAKLATGGKVISITQKQFEKLQ